MSDIAIIQKATLYEMADAIIDTTERTESFKVSDMPTLIREDVYDTGYNKGYAEGEADGKQSQYDEFWDNFQNNGKRTSYLFAFYNYNDNIFYPKYDMICTGSAVAMFSSGKITNLKDRLQECGVTLDTSGATAITEAFAYNSKLTNVPIVSTISASSIAYLFSGDPVLVGIEKVILKSDGSQAINKTFTNCYALENLTIEGTIGQNGLDLQWSTKLSKASITSVINALSTTTSGLSITLSKTAKEAAFTTNEWATLIATRTNWTINLV